jgi:hypothetical protein
MTPTISSAEKIRAPMTIPARSEAPTFGGGLRRGAPLRASARDFSLMPVALEAGRRPFGCCGADPRSYQVIRCAAGSLGGPTGIG